MSGLCLEVVLFVVPVFEYSISQQCIVVRSVRECRGLSGAFAALAMFPLVKECRSYNLQEHINILTPTNDLKILNMGLH